MMFNRAIARISTVLVALLMGGCASVNEKALRIFSSQAKAVAIVNGQLLAGFIDLLPDRTGTVRLASQETTALRCAGQFRYTSSASGTIDLRCSDGSTHDFQFTALTEISGYGYSQKASMVSSLTYGMSAVDAVAVLRPPAGKTLSIQADGESVDLQ